jgi:cytochrome c553
MRVEGWAPAARLLFCAALLASGSALRAQDPGAVPSPGHLALCAACHGAEGRSTNPQIPSLAGQPRVFIENQLVLIREGLRDVPQMKGVLDNLKDPDLVTLARYFNAQKPAPAVPATDTAAYRRGQALADRMHCASCHLPSYAGQQQVPRVAGQPEPFLRQSMQQLRDNPGPGRDSIMAAALHGLKDGDIADLAHFLAHHAP